MENKFNYSELKLLVLSILKEGLFTAADLGDEIFARGATSKGGLSLYASDKLHRNATLRRKRGIPVVDKAIAKQRVYSLLFRLKQQGLVQQSAQRRSGKLQITENGLWVLRRLLRAEQDGKTIPRFEGVGKRIKAKSDIIVIFDIPEEEKHKRVWLRETLLSLGYTLLQRSVWIGRNVLPEEFILRLRSLGIVDYVKIFSVYREGSIYD